MPKYRLMRREANMQLIALHRVGIHLRVAVNRRFAFGRDFKLNRARIRQDNWPVGQRLRRHWCERDARQLRV